MTFKKNRTFDAQLWSWVDRNAPELEEHLRRHPEDRERVAALRATIAQVTASGKEPLPARIGSFRILGRLGAGGMGVVYEAEQDHPRRKVALKVVRTVDAGDPRMRHWFQREITALARLEHEGIATIHAAGEAEDGRPWFAMELVRGLPLLLFAEQAQLDMPARVRLLLPVCAAVQHAHDQGVVHRDLKPGNILVTEAGAPKVLDFGLARVLGEAPASSRSSLAGVVGTFPYLSPEQARGEAADTRADVYALGVVLYELLTGALPIAVAGLPPEQALLRIVSEDPRDPRELRPVPKDLCLVLSKALRKEPGERYPSVAELASDLRRFLDGEPVRAHPPGAGYRLLRWLVRRWRRVAAALVLLLLATLLLIQASGPDLRSNLFRDLGPTRSRVSPFAGVEWQDESVRVLVSGEWHELLAMEGVRTGLLLEFCRQTGGPLWRKRFAEDLFEVLTRVLGREPQNPVAVGLRDAAGRLTETTLPMTKALRRSTWERRNRTPLSPVRWEADTPFVASEQGEAELLAVDGVPVERLRAGARKAGAHAWREEFVLGFGDLMAEATGRSPGDTVTLTLRARPDQPVFEVVVASTHERWTQSVSELQVESRPAGARR